MNWTLAIWRTQTHLSLLLGTSLSQQNTNQTWLDSVVLEARVWGPVWVFSLSIAWRAFLKSFWRLVWRYVASLRGCVTNLSTWVWKDLKWITCTLQKRSFCLQCDIVLRVQINFQVSNRSLLQMGLFHWHRYLSILLAYPHKQFRHRQ